MASFRLRYPGLYYDEALFTNGAIGADRTTFITARIWQFPLLLMPYIGALKSYLYWPIFKIFGVSIFSIRLPMIILMAISFVIVYWFLRKYTNTRTALISILFLCTNGSLVAYSRTDSGPIVIEFFLKCLGAFLVIDYFRRKNNYILVAGLLALFLGVFNKLNFLWFSNAFVVALPVIFWGNIKELPNEKRRFFVIACVTTFILSVTYYGFITNYYHLVNGLSMKSLEFMSHNLALTLSGEWCFSGMLKATSSMTWALALLTIQVAIMTLATYLGRRRKTIEHRLLRFSLVLVVLILGQITITPPATGAWHFLVIQPFWFIALAVAMNALLNIWGHCKLTRIISYSLLGVLITSQVILYFRNINSFKSTKNVTWSESTYDLIEETSMLDGSVIVADWGIQTQLITFDTNPGKYTEVFGPFDLNKNSELLRIKNMYFSSSKDIYIVTHPMDVAIFPESQANILTVAEELGDLRKIKVIHDDGRPTFEIYQLIYLK